MRTSEPFKHRLLRAPKVRYFGLLGVLALGTAACPQKTAIWVVAGSTSNHLSLARGEKRHHEEGFAFSSLLVERCTDHSSSRPQIMWEIQWAGEVVPDPWPSQIRYGAAPEGFEETAPARDLTPGCYEAWAGGTGLIQFKVDSFGQVSELLGKD